MGRSCFQRLNYELMTPLTLAVFKGHLDIFKYGRLGPGIAMSEGRVGQSWEGGFSHDPADIVVAAIPLTLTWWGAA